MSNPIQTSSTYRGTFRQGTYASAAFFINDIDGSPVDPDNITFDVTCNATSVSVLTGAVPEKVQTGVYLFDFLVEDSFDIGPYTITWYYEFEDVTYTATQSIVVSEDATNAHFYTNRIYLLRESLILMLKAAQFVPMYFRQAKPSRDFQNYYFTKRNWNQGVGTNIYVNKQLQTTGYTIDYPRGKVTFDTPLTQADVVNADYNFRWFDDSELDRFMSNALHTYNSFTPFTAYNFGTLPDRGIVVIMYGGCIDALRSIMFNTCWMEPAQFFGSEERSEKMFGQFDTLKQNYEKMYMELLNQKKLFPYRGLTKSIVTPEYTLPGGRSRWFRYLFSGSGDAG